MMVASFGLTLKQLREGVGLSQAELAQKAGMNQFGIAKLEQGKTQPKWETVLALSKALGVDCTVFAQEQEERPAAKPGRPRKAEEPAAEPEDEPKPKKTRKKKE